MTGGHMDDGFVAKAVSRSNRSSIAVYLLGIVLVLVGELFFYRYYYNFFLGPFNISGNDLPTQISGTKPLKYWLNVEGLATIYTYAHLKSEQSDGKTKVVASYYVMVFHKTLLLEKIQDDISSETLPAVQTGWLDDLAPLESMKIIAELENEQPEIKGEFLPYRLVTGNFRTSGYIGLAVGLVFIGLCVWGLMKAWDWGDEPGTHPLMKKLTRFGPVEFVTGRINAETLLPHTQIGNLHFTDNWIISSSAFTMMATKVEDVMWVYKHTVTYSVYFIPYYRSYSVYIHDRFGEVTTCTARNSKVVDTMIDAICKRTPWAIIGYSKDTEAFWKKNRSEVIAAIDERKIVLGYEGNSIASKLNSSTDEPE
jgi:hypothetical protein